MNNQFSYKNCFSFGVIAALLWHLFWFILIMPEVKIAAYSQRKCSTVFLGSFLKDTDLMPCQIRTDKKAKLQQDFSREAYFQKNFSSMHKPVVILGAVGDVSSSEPKQRQSSQDTHSLCFGISDVGQYLNNIDFSDMKNMFLREDLSSAIDFRIMLSKRGAVVSIVKCVGSGDPVLDFYIMRKFKMAIFKQPFVQSGWINVRFKIKE
ncbi:MAG: hypothetical protein ABIC68_05850 [Candidatus Omnitrophota bacterium]